MLGGGLLDLGFALGFDGCGFTWYCCSWVVVGWCFVDLSRYLVFLSGLVLWGWYNMGFVVLVMLFVLFVVDSCGSGGGGFWWFCWVIVGSAVKLVAFDMLWFCWALI